MNTDRTLLWKAWLETRDRFFAALAALVALVAATVLAGPNFLAGLAINHPAEHITYAGYVWSSLFDFYLQGLWLACAVILGLGGIRRERATGAATFTLSLPVMRGELVTTRAALAVAQAVALAVVPCLLIPLCAAIGGYSYSLAQAFLFGVLLAAGGVVFVALSLFLSAVFEGEYTAFLIGTCLVATVFFAFKARTIHRWSIFDVMSGARHIDPATYVITSLPWLGMGISLALAALLIAGAIRLVRSCDF